MMMFPTSWQETEDRPASVCGQPERIILYDTVRSHLFYDLKTTSFPTSPQEKKDQSHIRANSPQTYYNQAVYLHFPPLASRLHPLQSNAITISCCQAWMDPLTSQTEICNTDISSCTRARHFNNPVSDATVVETDSKCVYKCVCVKVCNHLCSSNVSLKQDETCSVHVRTSANTESIYREATVWLWEPGLHLFSGANAIISRTKRNSISWSYTHLSSCK